jgi:peptidyl-prolyl cis-trans isomerase SurA
MRKALIETNRIIFKKKIILLILFFFSTNLYGLENKILVKLENEIITTIDVENEKKFLSAINPGIKELNDEQIFEISKNSIMRQKIKKIEILNNNIELRVEDEFLDRLINSNYSRIGLKNLDDFDKFMGSFKINTQNIKEKMIIEALWNNLIFKKYSSKIKIDKEEIKKEILNNKSKSTSYHLFEILFNVSENVKLNEKYKTIKENINQSSFENAALMHSISNTSNLGGDLGWINENSLNKKIRNEISNLEKNQFSEPILSSSGFLILMVKDKKIIENKIDLEVEIKKMVNLKTNQQFTQFSNMYFNRVKKDVSINEL